VNVHATVPSADPPSEPKLMTSPSTTGTPWAGTIVSVPKNWGDDLDGCGPAGEGHRGEGCAAIHGCTDDARTARHHGILRAVNSRHDPDKRNRREANCRSPRRRDVGKVSIKVPLFQWTING